MSIDEVMTIAAEYRNAPTFVGRCKAKVALRAAIAQHVAEAVAREREGCAAVCQSIEDGEDDACGLARECVAAIRARAGKDVP